MLNIIIIIMLGINIGMAGYLGYIVGKERKKIFYGRDYHYLEMKLKEVCKELGLKKPKLVMEHSRMCCYNPMENTIVVGIGSILPIEFDWTTGKYINYNFRNLFDILLFNMYHELAHCIQYHNHKKWYFKQLWKLREWEDKDLKTISSEEGNRLYRNFKLEKYADRIALYLIDKFRFRVVKND